MNYNKMIDHTVLKADTPLETVKRICDEAMEYGFASVCINPCHVAYCADYLKDSDVNVCTVIGFPLGANTSAVKAFETKDAIANGADEIDMVMNIGALKDKNYDLVRNDVKAVVEAANGTLVKVILETCLLTEDEIKSKVQKAIFAYCPNNTPRDEELMNENLEYIFKGQSGELQKIKRRIANVWHQQWN